MDPILIAAICGVLGLVVAAFMAAYVLKQDQGSARIREISEAIKEGALAFLGREYKILAVFVAIVAVILGVVPNLGWLVAAAFVFGAVSSGLAGFIGMSIAIRANCRTAAAAQKSLNQGLRVSFRGGAVMGLCVVGIGILGLSILYFAFHNQPNFLFIIPGYGFGASSVAIFARVGGGIFTKAADTGADIVGKVEKGIPEDDPRNAAVIADFVGDNVGDVAGMGADLFESYVDSIIATMTLGMIAAFSTYFLKADIAIFWAILAGLVAGILIGESTNFFTSYAYKPTLNIAESSQTGGGTLITTGFANGLMSTAPPIILVVAAIIVAHHFADIYGIAIAGIGMLSTLGIQDATDAYGPVADNAGGIVEMSGLPPEIRQRTDALDSLGNTTAATGKGFAIGAAALTALALLLSYTQAAAIKLSEISLLDPHVIAGVFLGAMLPAIFCAMTLNAVGKTSFSIINEVRRQFREIKGLMEGTARPDYGRSVDLCTTAAIKQMLAPGLMTIIAPVVVGFLLGPLALAGFLVGAIACGFILAVTFANAGGSWDNAKKWIETGAFGGKGSDAHKAAVIGDTVGDPMKDTSGPSLNIMIKLMSIIALVIAPILAGFGGLI